MIRIGLMGFGKTGKQVASTLLRDSRVRLEWVIRRTTLLEHRSVPEFLGENSDEPGLIYSAEKITADELLDKEPVDVIIDFSSESGIDYYGEEAVKRKITILSAISHYRQTTIKLLHRYAKDTVVFWSPNITLGVNFLMVTAKYLKKIAPFADIEILEEHFKEKKGASGTAQLIAEQLEIDPHAVKSIRAGGIIGRHELIFGFPFQTVRLIHESVSREVFGNGVLFVAHNLQNKEPGFYNFEQLLLPYFSV